MNVRINQKMIKDMCGNTAFKRGEAYYYGNKVTFHAMHDEGVEAVVSGTEDFYVKLKKDAGGKVASVCTCPKLSSFQKECQHVAAVLIALSHHKGGVNSDVKVESLLHGAKEQEGGLMSFFQSKRGRSSAKQNHFETRKVLPLLFQFLFYPLGKHTFLAVKLQMNAINIKNIHRFLQDIQTGNSSILSQELTYTPELYCFQQDDDAVLEALYQLSVDETMYLEGKSRLASDDSLLIIPPSALGRLLPLLEKVSTAVLMQNGKHYDRLLVSNQSPSLKFQLTEAENEGYHLHLNGVSEMIMLDSYPMIFYKGRLFQLTREEYDFLVKLQQMIETTGEEQIPIHREQLSFFMEKVLPSLKKAGDVALPRHLEHYLKTPLKAKLFLDRVNNRLLAGLEFQYEHITINPLEERDRKAASMVIRDNEKEEKILRIMEESEFAKTDSGYILYNEELEYEFLTHVLPRMKGLVHIYATTAIRDRISRGNAIPRIRVKVKKERINWLEFKFEIDGIPQQQIRDILAALEVKRKYYRLKDGSLLSLETKEFAELNRFLHTIPAEKDWEALRKGTECSSDSRFTVA